MNELIATKLLDNFSLLTVGENKRPNFPWKEYQSNKNTNDNFINQFNDYSTKGIGIITGYDYLEVIDVDTKVFSTQLEMNDFWYEFLQTLRDTIINFDDKFVIYKTINGGYHILYKSKRVVGNKKLAVLKGHKQAILETRGVGGYVFVYLDNKVSKKGYFDIEFITDEDRESLWKISKSYNYIVEEPVNLKPNLKKEFHSDGVTPWEDFNNQTDIWTVISEDFEIPRNGQKRNHFLIKRYGSSSDHSGYVYKDSGCMFLFSTGTIYPHEKLINPFVAFTYKHHNGDYTASAKDLYNQGFGTRLQSKIEEIKPIISDEIIKIDNVDFPIDIFPKSIQFYLTECSSKLDGNIDFMGVSLMWLISVIIGNSKKVEVKKGWVESCVLWIAVVGKAGIGKTPSINNIIFPLMKENSKEIKKYIKNKEIEEHYNQLDKKDKESYPVPKIAKKKQFIANDITLEALIDLHQESDNSVGVFKDELAGWLKDMNKYRAGSDLEFWLSAWSSKSINMNRKTAKSSFVESPFIPVLGGIQPIILNGFSTEENKENGFLDRMLLSYPDAEVDSYNDNELDEDLLKWYNEVIIKFYTDVKNSVVRDPEEEIKSEIIKFSKEAKTEWKRIFNSITDKQNNDEENEYLKSMFPKQKSYIPRFSLLIHIFDSIFEGGENQSEISKSSILKAEKLSDYFVNNARKIKVESTEISDIKKTFTKDSTTFEKFQAISKKDPNFNRKKVAEILGVSRRTISRWVK